MNIYPVERLKFRIYWRINGRLHELYNINRTPTGLYFNPTYDPVTASVRSAGAKVEQFAFTYHEDGKSWDKRGQRRGTLRKTLEQPLASFAGAHTLWVMCCAVGSGEGFPLEQDVNVGPDDIVIDCQAPFGVEIMLSDKVLTLESRPERHNDQVYLKDQVRPVIIVEAFELDSPTLLPMRFPRLDPLVEGKNLFFDHPSHI